MEEDEEIQKASPPKDTITNKEGAADNEEEEEDDFERLEENQNEVITFDQDAGGQIEQLVFKKTTSDEQQKDE